MTYTNSLSSALPLLTIVAGLFAWLVVTRLRVGRILSPLSIALLVFVSVFGVRPLLLLHYQDFDFYGNDIRNGFLVSAFAGAVGVLCLITGYAIASQYSRYRLIASDTPPGRDTTISDTADLRPVCLVGVALLALWLLIQIFLGGGLDYLSTLFGGRSQENTATQAGVPSLVSALPVVSAVLASYTKIAITGKRALTHAETVWFWVVIAASVIPPLALGSRRFLIPTLLAAACAIAAPSWNKRVRARYVAAATLGFLVLSAIPFIRSAGARTSETQSFVPALIEYFESNSVLDVLSQYFISYDTEMFDYVALFDINRSQGINFGLGQASFGEFFLNPLPASLSPTLWSDKLLIFNFGGTCGDPYCPVLSTIGVLYTDGGFFTTAAGMLLFGAILFLISLPKTSNLWAMLSFTIWVFMPALTRGNSPLILSIAVEVFVVVLICQTIAGSLNAHEVFSKQRTQIEPHAAETAHVGIN